MPRPTAARPDNRTDSIRPCSLMYSVRPIQASPSGTRRPETKGAGWPEPGRTATSRSGSSVTYSRPSGPKAMAVGWPSPVAYSSATSPPVTWIRRAR